MKSEFMKLAYKWEELENIPNVATLTPNYNHSMFLIMCGF